MKYEQPSVRLFGDALRVIQFVGSKCGPEATDPFPPHLLNFCPAYDLDE